MSLLFNTLSRFFIAFHPRSKHLLISWLQSPSAVILEPKKRKSVIEAVSYFLEMSHVSFLQVMGEHQPTGWFLSFSFPTWNRKFFKQALPDVEISFSLEKWKLGNSKLVAPRVPTHLATSVTNQVDHNHK